MGIMITNMRISHVLKGGKMNSGQVIKELLEEQGIKQCYISKRLGIKVQTFNAQLSKDLTSANLFKICDILNISPEEIKKRIELKKDTDCSAKNSSVSQTTKLHK